MAPGLRRLITTGLAIGVVALAAVAYAAIAGHNRPVVTAGELPTPSTTASSGPLVIPGPSSADISQYGGLNDTPPLTLKKSLHVTDPTSLGRLLRELNSLPPYPSAPIPCPFDDGSYYMIDFHYVTRGDESIKIEARGCEAVFLGPSNQAVAWAIAGPNMPDVFALLNGMLLD